MEIDTKIICGDCKDVLAEFPDNTFDLIVTSPPYADKRNHTYGGIPPEEYVDWFLPRSEQLLRTLKPTGSFIINIKEGVYEMQRHTYVIELVLALKKQGWLWVEEFIWHKLSAMPAGWPRRTRDAWEHLYQFTKTKEFKMYPKRVTTIADKYNIDKKIMMFERFKVFDKQTFFQGKGTGSGLDVRYLQPREYTESHPTNVILAPTVCSNKNHSAAFPKHIPYWFILLLTDEYDTILDPFMGSGTTLETAQMLNRNSVGIDIMPEYCNIAKQKISETKMILF